MVIRCGACREDMEVQDGILDGTNPGSWRKELTRDLFD